MTRMLFFAAEPFKKKVFAQYSLFLIQQDKDLSYSYHS